MATVQTTTKGSRSKRTSVVALGLVAILAGIAVAYFLTSQKYPNNRAVGGSLTVDATLPLDFTSEPLYPTNKDGTGDFASQSFTITNNNTVPVYYELFATCEECIPDPADTPEQADARAKKIDQFNNLYIDVRKSPDGQNCPVEEAGAVGAIADPITTSSGNRAAMICPSVYHGKLSELKPGAPAKLGEIQGDGEEMTYEVRLWLKNDASRAQPQSIESIWEFFVNAKTPQTATS